MIGKIININNNLVDISLDLPIESIKSLINFHVVFDNENLKIVGEVHSIGMQKASISLIGEINNGVFYSGISKKPYFGASCRYITVEEIAIIIGSKSGEKVVNIGRMPQYDGYKVNVPISSFFSNHLAILGNTGSGKSYGLTRIIQNLFGDPNSVPKKSNLFIFDAYGEYHNALTFLNNNPDTHFKIYTTKVSKFENVNEELLRIPLWLLDVDDYALLLGATSITQLPIIEKALKLVSIFCREESQVIVYKNDIIASALLEIMYSGGTPMQIRDQIFAVLTNFKTADLNLETKVAIPGWIRTLRQCLIIDKDGKIADIQLVTEFLQSFVKEGLELSLPDGTYPYTLAHLKEAFDFAFISEGLLKNNKVYEEANVLRVRLHSLINSDYKDIFDHKEFLNREQYINKLVTTKMNERAQVVNFNINHVDDRLAKTIVKLLSKMLFEYSVSIEERAAFPVHLILEEAHRYVQNDDDINILGYNIFERIAREGRKYGVILILMSQRPSEISETAISQCANFLMYRMQHPRDLNYVKEMIPNISEDTMNKFRLLQPGTCIAFGVAFKIPVLLRMDLPNPPPHSQNANINKYWYE